MFNPYGLSGWSGNQNPDGLGSSASIPPQPSVFGLLPAPASRTPEPNLLAFNFTSFNPNISNSAVIGPRSRAYFRITTDTPTVGFTVFFDATGNPMAIIEWLDQPVVEIRGILSKRRASDWLALAQNGRFVTAFSGEGVTCPRPAAYFFSHRKMEAIGKHFVWAPGGDYIFLYGAGVGQPKVYAQVSRDEDSVKLEFTPEAIQIGLLEICVVATFLLQCGKNIG